MDSPTLLKEVTIGNPLEALKQPSWFQKRTTDGQDLRDVDGQTLFNDHDANTKLLAASFVLVFLGQEK